jgi:hypothetical protein
MTSEEEQVDLLHNPSVHRVRGFKIGLLFHSHFEPGIRRSQIVPYDGLHRPESDGWNVVNKNGVVVLCGDIAAPSFAAKLLNVRKETEMSFSTYHVSSRQSALQP